MSTNDEEERGFRELDRALRDAALEERQVLEEAQATTFSEGEARVAEYLAVELDAGVRRSWLVGIAAVLLASLGLGVWALTTRTNDVAPGMGEGAPRGSQLLGGRPVDLVAPMDRAEGTVQSWTSFEIEFAVDPKELPDLRIVIYSGTEPGGAPLAMSPWLTGTVWNPIPGECDDWPDTIYWEVRSFEPRALLGSRVSRRSRD